MKKTVYFVLLTAAILMAGACKKEVSLTGTSWYGSFTTQVDVAGYGQLDLLSRYTLVFDSETEGHIMARGTLSQRGIVVHDEQERQNFSYTFDGTSGTMTYTGSSHAHGTATFVYDKGAHTITVPVQSQEILDRGITHLVFSLQE